jgi:polyhydroxyalkanoate synthesis regulator phasin
MASTFNSKIEATRRVLRRTPAYGMLEVSDATGKIVNKATGQSFNNIEAALEDLSIYKMVDFRRIGSSPFAMGQNVGAASTESDLIAINRYLRSAPEATLNDRGLGHLVGKQLDAVYAQYNWGGNTETLKLLTDPTSVHQTRYPGFTSITDEGLMKVSHLISGTDMALTAEQQSIIKSLAGVPTYRKEFVQDFFKNISQGANDKVASQLGKLGKRGARILAPREVSFTSEEIQKTLSRIKLPKGAPRGIYKGYDHVDLLLRRAAGETLNPGEMTYLGFVGGMIREELLSSDEAFDQVAALAGLKHPLDTGINNVDKINLIPRLKQDLAKALQRTKDPSKPSISIADALKEIANGTSTNNQSDQIYSEIVNGLPANIDTTADGAIIGIEDTLSQLVGSKRIALNRLKSSIGSRAPGTVTSEEIKKLSGLQGEYEQAQETITGGRLRQNPITIGIPQGTVKAEFGVSPLDDLANSLVPGSSFSGKRKRLGKSFKAQIKELESKMGLASRSEKDVLQKRIDMLKTYQAGLEEWTGYGFVGSTTNIKPEMGGSSIAMNVAMKHDKQVFEEAIGPLVDPDYFSPQVRESVEENLQRANDNIQAFLSGQTGIPREVVKDIEYQAREVGLLDKSGRLYDVPRIPGTEHPESLLDPSARGLAKRNRAEIEDVLNALRSNPNPRSHPGILNRVRDHYAKGSFRIKEGKVNLAIPLDKRYDIRTYESSLESIPGVKFGGYDVQRVRLDSGEDVDIPFLQASFKDEQMLIPGIGASSFKPAESGFDLDDKDVASLRTFRDPKGRKKIFFIGRRDPKGLEESIALTPNFKYAETVQTIYNDYASSSDYFSDLADEERERLLEEGVNPSIIDDVFGKAKILLKKNKKATFGHKTTRGTEHFASEDEAFAIETMLRRAVERVRGTIPKASDEYLGRLAAAGSASHRGRGAIDPVSGMTMQVARNLSPEQAAPYSMRGMVALQYSPSQSDEIRNEALRFVNDQLPSGVRKIKANELQSFMDGTLTLPGITPERAIEYGGAAIQKLNEQSVIKAVIDQQIRNTIGVSANRSAFVSGSLNTVEGVLRDPLIQSKFGPAIKEAQIKYGFGTINLSDVVDMVKQLSGGNELRPLSEVIASLDDPEEIKRIRNAYEAIASVAAKSGIKSKYGGIPTADTLSDFQIGDVLEAQIEQSGKLVGFVRATAILSGKGEGELPGFDPIAYDERLNIPADKEASRLSVIAGQKDAMESARLQGIPESEISALEKQIKQLEGATESDYKKAMILKPNTPLYEEFAQSAQIAELRLKQEAEMHSQDLIMSRQSSRLQRPIAVAEARDASRAFLKSPEMSSLFKEMQILDEGNNGAKAAEAITAQKRIIQNQISMKMAESLRAIRDNYNSSSGNVLDLLDTLEAEMTSIYGETGRSIFSNLGQPGFEDSMMDIFNLARTRREITRQSFDAKHFGLVQQIYRDHVGDTTKSLLEVSESYASEFVAFHRTNADERVDQSLLHFMEMVSRRSGTQEDNMTGLSEQVRETIQEAFGYHNKVTRLAEIEEEARMMGSSEMFTGKITDTAAKLRDDLGQALKSMDSAPGSIAKSPYKRVVQSFNHGELGKLLESKNVRRSGVAAIALIGASFLYQRNKKKDLTEGDVAGPPLLPGGSAYDDRPPSRDAVLQSAQAQSQGYGMQYQVNTTGSMGDLNRLRGLFGDVVDGPINSTMYNGMPSLGKDPYSDIASNF